VGGVLLGRFLGVLHGVGGMAVRVVGLFSGLGGLALGVMRGGLLVMLGSFLMVFGGLFVMLGGGMRCGGQDGPLVQWGQRYRWLNPYSHK